MKVSKKFKTDTSSITGDIPILVLLMMVKSNIDILIKSNDLFQIPLISNYGTCIFPSTFPFNPFRNLSSFCHLELASVFHKDGKLFFFIIFSPTVLFQLYIVFDIAGQNVSSETEARLICFHSVFIILFSFFIIVHYSSAWMDNTVSNRKDM